MTRIRSATSDDALGINAILNGVIRDTSITFTGVEKSEADTVAAIAEADAYLVADDGGKVVGFASFGPFRNGDGYAATKEHSISLAPEERGFGLGRKLLTALEKEAVSQGLQHLIAGVSAENLSGIAFHEVCGYAVVGRLPNVGQKFNRSIDLVLMQKTL